ncbi:MAG: HAD family hydrolase [Chloroflexota bacterium]
MSSPVKGVLFDLDNTLIDWHNAIGWDESEKLHLSKVHQYLADKKQPLSCTVETLTNDFRNRSYKAWDDSRATLRTPQIVDTLQETLAEYGFAPDDTITMRDIIEAYEWGIENGVVVFPDVPDALQKLIDDDIQIGIVTNAWQPMWMRDPELAHHDLLKYFPHENRRISAADVGHLKPHPAIFYHALEQIGTSPEETLFVGDNISADIAGAQGIGMRAILRVNYGQTPLMSSVLAPDAIVEDFEHLLRLVDDWDTAIAE